MFLHPLGFLALLALPAIVGLHLFRRRFRKRTVSALFLWDVRSATPLSGRRRQPLEQRASLWLELLAALALGLALAGPRSCAGDSSRHFVAVLDSSASMGALHVGADEAQAGALDARVRAAVADAIGDLEASARVSLIASGARPQLLSGPGAFPQEAVEALEAWRPRAARHDLSPSLALALELSSGARVVLFTDRFEPERYPEQVEVRALGQPTDNWAIAHAARSREVSAETGAPVERVFLTIASHAAVARSLTLRLSADGGELAPERIAVEPGAREHLALELPAGTGFLEARIDDDALAIDNRVLLAPVPPRTIALGCDLPAEQRTQWALSGPGGGLERLLAVVPDSIEVSPEEAHFLISDAASERAWTLVLHAPGEEREDLVGPFLMERRHAVLEGVTLEGIVWSSAPDFFPPGMPLVSAGNRPLVSEERQATRTVWHASIDAARSSLAHSPDWPILLSNMIELRRASLPGLERTNVALGGHVVYRPRTREQRGGAQSSGEPKYTLRGPLGGSADGAGAERELVAAGALWIDGLAEPGRYTLSEDGRELAAFAVQFVDPAESDLRSTSSGRRESETASAGVESDRSRAEVLLTALVLALVLADVFVVARTHRRAIELEGAAA